MGRTEEAAIGCIVWHDLLTNEVARAKRFYTELLGWEYQIEHASNFAWNSREVDYPLILAHGEAHGGFVDPGQDVSSHWIAFVTVADVDAVVAKAKKLGANIARSPFDVPGVGRNAVIQDPQGAIICPFMPTHSFPPPSGTFLWEELITDDVESAKAFYGELFGWQANDIDRGEMGTYTLFKRDDGTNVAGILNRQPGLKRPTAWLTYLATDDVDITVTKAISLGASTLMKGTDLPNIGQLAVLIDSTGATFGLFKPSKSSDIA